jgi:hypothetical protein
VVPVRRSATGKQEHGEGHGPERVRAAPHDADEDVARRPIENESEGQIGEDEGAEDGEHRIDDLLAPPQYLHADRGGRAADQTEEQGVRPAEHALPAHEDREDHRGDEADACVEQNRQRHGRERDRHELGTHGSQVTEHRSARQHHREHQRQQQQRPIRAVELGPEQHDRDREDREYERVVEHRAEHAPDGALAAGASFHLDLQRPKLVMLLAAHDLVLADDLLPFAHLIPPFADRRAQLLAPAIRRGPVGDDRRSKDSAQQLVVETVADRGAGIGVESARARNEGRKRRDAVDEDVALLIVAADDRLAAHIIHRAARCHAFR